MATTVYFWDDFANKDLSAATSAGAREPKWEHRLVGLGGMMFWPQFPPWPCNVLQVLLWMKASPIRITDVAVTKQAPRAMHKRMEPGTVCGIVMFFCVLRQQCCGMATFFFAILIMDPPQFVKSGAEAAGGVPAESFRDEIIAGERSPTLLDKIAGNGVEASQWGGLFVNLIIATAGCVIGFVIGVGLAFGRQSDQPFFS